MFSFDSCRHCLENSELMTEVMKEAEVKDQGRRPVESEKRRKKNEAKSAIGYVTHRTLAAIFLKLEQRTSAHCESTSFFHCEPQRSATIYDFPDLFIVSLQSDFVF